jgi:hypothetical protein
LYLLAVLVLTLFSTLMLELTYSYTAAAVTHVDAAGVNFY